MFDSRLLHPLLLEFISLDWKYQRSRSKMHGPAGPRGGRLICIEDLAGCSIVFFVGPAITRYTLGQLYIMAHRTAGNYCRFKNSSCADESCRAWVCGPRKNSLSSQTDFCIEVRDKNKRGAGVKAKEMGMGGGDEKWFFSVEGESCWARQRRGGRGG